VFDPFSFLSGFGINQDMFANNFASQFRSSGRARPGANGGFGSFDPFDDLLRHVQEMGF